MASSREVKTLTGRKEIIVPVKVEELTMEMVGYLLKHCLETHNSNVEDMEMLEKYLFGDRSIVEREKKIRPDIDNKIRVNYPVKIVRDLNAYFLEKPIAWTSKDGDEAEKVETLSKVLRSEGKDLLDMELAQTAGLYGVAYRGQYSEVASEGDYPLLLSNHSPKTTFIVKSSYAGHQDLFSVSITEVLNQDSLKEGNLETENVYLVYTKDEYAEFKETDNGYEMQGGASKHFFGDIPIVEYANNQWRYGDFEMIIDLIDALDKLYSDRVNAVEQFVQSILVFVNCDIKDDEISSLSDNLAISIKSYNAPSAQGGLTPSDVKFVTSPLNQKDTQSLTDEIENYITALTGIMTRSERTGGGQDTGEAVYMRDGGKDMETIARVKEASFMGSERKCLKVITNILRTNSVVDVNASNIEIKFTRNASNNLLNKANAIAILNNTRILKPEDTLSIAGISSAPVDMAERGVRYWESRGELGIETDESVFNRDATDSSVEGNQPSVALEDEVAKETTDKTV